MKNLLAAILIFACGMAFDHEWEKQSIPTWGEIIEVMPSKLKENIAIDYCVANRSMCRNLPLSSPINPMDGK